METAIVSWGYIGIMERNMENTYTMIFCNILQLQVLGSYPD